MSADNYNLIDVDEHGRYVVTMGFESDTIEARYTDKDPRFDTYAQAFLHAMSEYTEYGVRNTQSAALSRDLGNPLYIPFVGNTPTRGSEHAAGWDMRAECPQMIEPGIVTRISLGVRAAIPEGFYGQLVMRSSLAARGAVCCGGLIDSDYRGFITLLASSVAQDISVAAGDRVCQMVILPVPKVEWRQVDKLSESVRGEGGFGSTGR